MAKLKFKLVSIYAPRNEGRDLMRRLQEMSVIDIDTAASDDVTSECPEGYQRLDTNSSATAYDRNAELADNALKIINERFPQKKGLLASFSGPRSVSRSEFYMPKTEIEKALATVNDIVEDEREIAEQNAEKVRLYTTMQQMLPWKDLDVALSFTGTSKTTAFIGTVAGIYSLTELLAEIARRAPESDVYGETVNTSKDSTYIFVCCPKAQEQSVENALREMAFARPVQITSKLPRDKIHSKELRIAECETKIKQALNNISEKAKQYHTIELLSDYCRVCAERYRAIGEASYTKHTVLIKGYVAEIDIPYLKKTLEKDFTVVFEIEDADEDLAPVRLKNNAFSRPAEVITEMYALPSKEDIDPTPITGFFYYLFFGMMFSDAGYGLIMIIATWLGLKKLHPSPSMKKTMKLFNYCGISTFLWGLVFGSFFGDSISVISRNFFGHEISLPALINPMGGGAVTLLILSLGLGMVQIIAGLVAKFITCMKNGDKAGAFFDSGLWITTLIGLGLLAVGIMAYAPLTKVGGIVALVSAVGLILTQGRDKKNPIMKLMGGLISLYDITGYVSDLLSFSRLMALGLTTSAMSAVFNLLGTLAGKGVAGVVLMIIIFPIGHAINFALNILGAYVHTLRLQYVELFSKFYEGGGREFKPLTFKSKYVGLDETQIKEEN